MRLPSIPHPTGLTWQILQYLQPLAVEVRTLVQSSVEAKASELEGSKLRLDLSDVVVFKRG